MARVQENINQREQKIVHNPSRRELVKKILIEMIKALETKPSISIQYPLCATSQIQYYSHLKRDCQKKYDELYSLKQFDIQQKKLLEYLKESLNKMPQEEGEYNRQSALLACQTILKREEKNEI